MKKIAYYTLYMFGAVLLGVSANSCTENLTEITEVTYDRLFSPVDLEVRVRSQINAEVNWEAVDNAETYVLELYMGESVATGTFVEEAETTDVTYTFTELDSDTDYAVQVKATATGIEDSKWVEETFETGTENIFNSVDASLLGSDNVTLSWTAGAEVTSIVVTSNSDSSDVITWTLSDSEIEAGQATVTGLTPETTYTAVLYRSTTKRGTTSFTTTVDIGDAIAIYADDTEEDILAVFAALTAGETVCLLPADDGTDVIAATTDPIALTVPCTITGLASKPVTAGLNFKITTEEAGDLVISNLNFAATTSDVFLEIDQMATGSNVTITGCTIDTYKNLLTETSAVSTTMGTLTIDDCIISNISARAIDFQKKLINFATVNFQNNTVYNSCSGSDLLRFDYVSGRVGAVYNLTNNTLYDVNASSKGIIYIRSNSAGSMHFTCNVTKNIFAFSSEATNVYFSADSKTDNVVFSNNYYYNATSLTTEDTTGKVFDTTGTTLTASPFTDAANADFTLTDDDMNYYEIGDPRWVVAQ